MPSVPGVKRLLLGNLSTDIHYCSIFMQKLLIHLGHDSCSPVVDATGYDSAPGISLNTDSSTALHLAALHSHVASVEYLCRAFPHIINWQDREGRTALMLAAQSSNPGHAPSSTFHVPPTGRPRAVSAGTAMASEDTATITTLLSYHASLTLVDHLGNTALHHASAWGNLKAVRILLSAGAPPLAPNKANHTTVDYSVTKQAAQYFQSIVSDLERRRADAQREQLKLNTTVRAIAAEDAQSAGARLSPVSPLQTRTSDVFPRTLSPTKTAPGGIRLVIDTDNNELADMDDDDVPFTAKRIERSPANEQSPIMGTQAM